MPNKISPIYRYTKVRLFGFFLIWFALLAPIGVRGEALPNSGIGFLSPQEFRELAVEIAPKVNLFKEVWAADPEAEFYGGTTRDYLYWIKGKFRGARNRAEAEKVVEKLREMKSIDVRDFIIGDSDLDVVARARPNVSVEAYGITKLDAISQDIFDPATKAGQNEKNQGFIPIEKIRLSKKGIVSSAGFGDGLKEIFEGKLSIQFAPDEIFQATHYATQKINHPILLATRFIRLQAMNYFYTHGAGVPDAAKLSAAVDREVQERVRGVVEKSINGLELKPYLEKPQFKKWINGNIQKSFRSYTNPTAALKLMKIYKVDELVGKYDELEPINNYLFAKYREPKEVAEWHKKMGVQDGAFYQKKELYFPDGLLYHGTREEAAFRSILFQGILPSESGSGGAGLYGVGLPQREFSEQWGGSKDRLVSFEVKNDARIVDITKGEGLRVWEQYQKANGASLEKFAEDLDIDIIRYPYGQTEAFVVKNSEALERGRGVHRQILSYSKALEEAQEVRSVKDLVRLRDNLKLSRFSSEEIGLLMRNSPAIGLIPEIQQLKNNAKGGELARAITENTIFSQDLRQKLGSELFSLLHEDSFYSQALRERQGDILFRRLGPQIETPKDFWGFLKLGVSFYGKKEAPVTFGGMNVEIPSLGRLKSKPQPALPFSIGEILVELAKVKGWDKRAFQPQNAEELRLALELWDQSETAASPAEKTWRKQLLEGIKNYRGKEEAAKAGEDAVKVLRKNFYLSDPSDLITQLLHLSNSSRLNQADKEKLRSELWNIHEKNWIGLRDPKNFVNPNDLPAAAMRGHELMLHFFRSPALNDYPQLALEFLVADNDMSLKGYSSEIGLERIYTARKELNEASRGHKDLLERAIADSDFSKTFWDRLYRDHAYYGQQGRLIDRAIAAGLPSTGKIPPAAVDGLIEGSLRSSHGESAMLGAFRTRAFLLDSVVANEAFPKKPIAKYFAEKLLESFLRPNEETDKIVLKEPALNNLLEMVRGSSRVDQNRIVNALIQLSSAPLDETFLLKLNAEPFRSHPNYQIWKEALALPGGLARQQFFQRSGAKIRSTAAWLGCAGFFQKFKGSER